MTSATAIHPYLFFEGRCEEALAFYADALGAQVTTLMRWRDMPPPVPPGAIPDGAEDKVMHAEISIGDAVFMASDGRGSGSPSFTGTHLALSFADEDAAERAFAALQPGAQVMMPMGPTFFSSRFGMLTDRFGVGWMIMAGGKQ